MSYVNNWSAYSKCRDAFVSSYDRTVGAACHRCESRSLWADMFALDFGIDAWDEAVKANNARLR